MKPYGLYESKRGHDRAACMDVADCHRTGAPSRHQKQKSIGRRSTRRYLKRLARRAAKNAIASGLI